MPDGAVELAACVLQSNQFQLITFIARRSLIAVLVRWCRHLVNGKRTGVVDEVRGSRAVLGSARLQARVSPPTMSMSITLLYWKQKCRRKTARCSISFRNGVTRIKIHKKSCFTNVHTVTYSYTYTSHINIVFIHFLINFLFVRPPT